jgi:hypothetical protein
MPKAVAACAGVQRMLRQLNPDGPLSAETVDIARYRAGRPDYPLGMAVGLNDNGRCLEETAGAATATVSVLCADCWSCHLA